MTAGGMFVRWAPPLIRWYPPVKIDKDRVMQVPEKDLAFRQNISTVIREAKCSGLRVVLVPVRINPFTHANRYKSELKAYALNEKVLYDLAKEFDVVIAPFPGKVISRKNWVDTCHLNGAGNFEKANHIVPYILEALKTGNSKVIYGTGH